MYGQDSERGRPRGQSSWGNDWNSSGNNPDYGHKPSRDGREDFRSQSYGRDYSHEETSTSKIVCQNYLQNKCTRGNSCLFLHPPTSSGSTSRHASNSDSQKQSNAWLNFCPNFQRGQCPFSDDCRLLHVSQRDETEYRTSGDIPTGVVEQAMSKAMVMDWAYIGNQPHCKDYLQGACSMRGCNFRHLNTDQYVIEVLGALKDKFQSAASDGYQDRSRDSGFSMGNRDARPTSSQSNRTYGSNDSMECENKRMRGQKSSYEGDARMPSRWDSNNKRQASGNGNYQQPRMPSNEDFLDSLRRDNISMTKTNEDVKKTAESVEEENSELRKALRLALDLNSHARNLQEFRNHLRDIQSSLKKRGFQSSSFSDAGNWNNMQNEPASASLSDNTPVIEKTSSSQDNRVYGDRYSSNQRNTGGNSSGMRNTEGRYNSDYNRSDREQRSDSKSFFKSNW